VGFVDSIGGGVYSDVSGDMAVTGAVGRDDAKQYNTLDEPIKDTVVSIVTSGY